ncbi:hypothetical protein DINM_003352 [Dirofilaria immitis]|nr:hypothetical protein [Dirofilaria immitis]
MLVQTASNLDIRQLIPRRKCFCFHYKGLHNTAESKNVRSDVSLINTEVGPILAVSRYIKTSPNSTQVITHPNSDIVLESDIAQSMPAILGCLQSLIKRLQKNGRLLLMHDDIIND